MYFRVVLSQAGSGSYGPQRLPYTPKWVSPREGGGGAVVGSRLAPLTPSLLLACVTLRSVKPVSRWYIKDRRRNAECLVRSTSQLKKSPKINKLYYSLPGSFRCKTHNSEVPLYFRFPFIVTTARKCKFIPFLHSTIFSLRGLCFNVL